jgi:ribosome-associated heat shock protein Hsp15
VEAVRIDKWLWAARFFKTRSAATEAVAGGRVHVNDTRVKPSREVRVGDTVVVRIGQLEWTVTVQGLSDKRGPAKVAATLYDETEASVAARAQRSLELRASRPLGADLGARPTKQDRRRIEQLRRR